MELADGAAQEPFLGQVARQPSAPRAESAAHAGFDDETVETGLPLGLQERGQGHGIISIEHGGSVGGRFSQQGRKFSGAERGISSGVRPKLASCSSTLSLRSRLDLAFSALAGRAAMPRRENWMVIDSLLISLQGGPRPHAGSRITRTQALDLIRLDDLDRSCGQDLNRRRPDVVCLWRPFARTGAHCFSFGATAWRVAEPMAKSPREMGVVAKAASVRDLAERLACLQRPPAMQKARGVIQTKRVNEFAAGRATRREQLLQVTHRDSRFGCDFARAEIRIGIAVLDDVADTRKQSLRMARDGKRIGWRKQRAEEIVDRKL